MVNTLKIYQMNILAIIGLVSSISGIATLFIPDSWKSRKVTLAIIVVLITGICGIVVNQQSKLNRIAKVSAAANKLVERRDMDFTSNGFTQAGLSFLEQNKDLYPDSYERAKEIAIKSETEPVEASFTIAGIIKGIAILNDN